MLCTIALQKHIQMPANISFGACFRKASLNLVTELDHAGSRIHKISSSLSKVIGDGGRGRGTLTPPFIL